MNQRGAIVRGATLHPFKSPLSMRSAAMMPCVQGLGLIRPQAIGHRAWLNVLLGL